MPLFQLTRRLGRPILSSIMNMVFSIVTVAAVVVLVLRTGLLGLVRPVSLTVETGAIAA